MFEKFGKWLDSKGGAAHVLAGTWMFLIAAYAMNPPFHTFALKVKDSLPSWVEDMITAGVSLVAFYKTWTAKPRQTELDKTELAPSSSPVK